MIHRQELHHLLDELPESDLVAVARILEALRATAGETLINALDSAPIDDETDDDDFDGGLSEARRAAEAGLGISTAQLRRELGLP